MAAVRDSARRHWAAARVRSASLRSSMLSSSPTRPDRVGEEESMDDRNEALRTLAAAQWRLALSLTAAMMAIYFGFILLVAFDKPLLGTILRPGLSLGTLLGALVIVSAWGLIWVYVRWANSHFDRTVASIREKVR